MAFEAYVQKRIAIFEKELKTQQDTLNKKEKLPISITTPMGKYVGKAHETTPFEVSHALNPAHAQLLVAKVNGQLWDAHRVLESDAELEFLDFSTEEGKQVFWHSSAHVLGEAAEKCFCAHLCLGPPTESGFFYEMQMDRTVVPSDYPGLKKSAQEIMRQNQRFQRLELDKGQLLEMFAENPLKIELIEQKVKDRSTVYRCGPLIDFCLGPHIPSTRMIGAFEITHHSSSFFLGDSKRPVLQRIFGISFPTPQQMRAHLAAVEEAKKYNHRKLGTENDLFFFSQVSPGSCFFLPAGAFIYNALIAFIREEYASRGFSEVVTPNLFSNSLWKTSGHWDNYRDDMFCLHVDAEDAALKPMNCPSHCLIFERLACSYRDLPLRLADFGVLHRNEISGALSGLTRVRRFQQDDAHIFAQEENVAAEIEGALDFLGHVYGVLGFRYEIGLSTRPETYMGDLETWDAAEQQLRSALDRSGHPWTLNEGDGAFYGPKIDVTLCDAMGRKHQCGTIQLDFQMPRRFDITYAASDGTSKHPVMIHRAILGSVERMLGILLEHFKGRLPPWLNPNQVIIIPVSASDLEYAEAVCREFSGLQAHVDRTECTLSKKVLNAEKKKYSYTLVVGARDASRREVCLRGLLLPLDAEADKNTDNGNPPKKKKPVLTLPLSTAASIVQQAVRQRVIEPSKALEFISNASSSSPAQLGSACAKLAVGFAGFTQVLEKLLLTVREKALEALRSAVSKFCTVRTASCFSPKQLFVSAHKPKQE